MIDKRIVLDMIAPAEGKAKYWIQDWMGVAHTMDGFDVMQISLVPRKGDEPFPGLTDQLSEFIASDAVVEVLGAVAEHDRKVINIRVTAPKSTHSEEA